MIKRYLTSLVYGLSIGLFCSFSAMATVCFLPDGNCGGVNYGYKDGSGSTCTYKTRAEANLKKGECEEVQKQGFCFYLACSMSKSDCDKAAENAPNHDKCCVPCGNCWKVDDCSIPDISTCTGAGYETEQTCKNQNLGFEPNGKFDKNGTACGKCKNGTPPHPCSYWNTLSQTYMTEAACRKQGGIFHPGDDKDSDNNICGTCDPEPETCTSGYSTAYQSQADCASNETFSSKGTANGKVCGKCTASTPECTPIDCSEYTYTTLSDLSNTASYEQCDNGCGTTTYRCKSGYTYSNGKCVYVPVTPVCNKGEYSSKTVCETNHPDTICTQNSSTKCWIGKCDTKNNKYYYESEEACYEGYQDECYDCNYQPCEQVDEDSNCWFINCGKIGFYDRESDCESKSPTGNCTFDAGLGCYMPDKVTCDKKYGLFASEQDCENWGWEYECTKVGNCWKSDITRIEIYFAEDHRFRFNYVEDGDFSYGHTKLINSSGKIVVDNINDDGNKYEIPNGTYTINTTDFIAFRGSSISRQCFKMYVRKIVIQGSDGSEAYFDIDFPEGECSDCYPLTYTKKKSVMGVTLGGCYPYNYYYELSMNYEFKSGITYNVLLYDLNEKCDESCF